MQAVRIGGWFWVVSKRVKMATVSFSLWKRSSLCRWDAKLATRSIKILIKAAFLSSSCTKIYNFSIICTAKLQKWPSIISCANLTERERLPNARRTCLKVEIYGFYNNFWNMPSRMTEHCNCLNCSFTSSLEYAKLAIRHAPDSTIALLSQWVEYLFSNDPISFFCLTT